MRTILWFRCHLVIRLYRLLFLTVYLLLDLLTIDKVIRTVNFYSIKDFVQELCKKLDEHFIEVYELQEQASHDRQRRQLGRRGVSDLNATVGDYLLVLEHNPVPSGAEASHWSLSFFYLGTVVCD